MLIRDGVVLHYNWLEAGCDVGIADGRIAMIGVGLPPLPGEEVIDAEGCYVLPGLTVEIISDGVHRHPVHADTSQKVRV